MTETISHTVNIRKRRLMEAYEKELEENVAREMLTATRDDNIASSENEDKQTLMYEEQLYNYMMKIASIQFWKPSPQLEKWQNSTNESHKKRCSWNFQNLEALQDDPERTMSCYEESTLTDEINVPPEVVKRLTINEEDRCKIRESLREIMNDRPDIADFGYRESLTPSALDMSPKLNLNNIDMKALEKQIRDLEEFGSKELDNLEEITQAVQELQNLQDEKERLEDLKKSRNIKIKEKELKKVSEKEISKEPVRGTEITPQTPKRQGRKQHMKISATSTPISKKAKIQKRNYSNDFEADENGMVTIGPNGTMIAKKVLEYINWNLSGAAITRKILVEVFGRKTLASHSLTGKPSPAFIGCEKPMKNQLDPLKVADVIHMVMQITQMTAKEVRNAITTKCADENKMFRQRTNKTIKAASKLKQKDMN